MRQFPDLVIDYQYSCWETGFIGFGRMTQENVDEQPTHCSYNTPEDLNEGVRLLTEGRWQVWPGNPHFNYDELTGLYSYYEGDGETQIDNNNVVAESSDSEQDLEPIVVPARKVVPASRR